MKKPLALLVFVLLAACGSEHDLKLQKGYTVQPNLTSPESVEISYQNAYNYRFISVGSEQISACNARAADFQAESGVTLDITSLKITPSEAERHCTKRNLLKQCEGIRYVYTFACQYQVKR